MRQLSAKETSELEFWIDHVHGGGCERESGRPFLEQWRDGARGRLKFYFENIHDAIARDGATWVDVGCGPFSVLMEAPAGITKIMVDPLMKFYLHHKLVPPVEDTSRHVFIEAAGEDLPLADETAEMVFCTNTLDHVADPWQTLSELVRILKVGGHLIIDTDTEGQTDEMHPHALKVAEVEKCLAEIGAPRTFSHFPKGVKRRPGAVLYFGFFKKTARRPEHAEAVPAGASHPSLVAEGVDGFNIIKLSDSRQGDRYYAILQGDGAFSYEKVVNSEYTVVLDGKSVGQVKRAIGRYSRSRQPSA